MASRTVRLLRLAKRTLLRSGLARAAAPASGAAITGAYLARLGAWARDHAGEGFDADRGEPAFRYGKRERLWEHVIVSEGLEGSIDYLEFGVATGTSFRWWLVRNADPASRFAGFDTFEGLPEAFGPIRAGAFAGPVPEVDDPRARFEVGFFQDTLGPFLAVSGLERREAGRPLVVHLDADLYASTLFVLTRLAPVLRPGDVLLFDEFGVPAHEFKAFTEFVHAYAARYTVLGQANALMQLAVRVEAA